jgi:gliding motility-associated-like protein
LGISEPASSIFLQIDPTDRANQLSWSELVPWDNYKYAIFRKNSSGILEEIATVLDSPFTDTGLQNGETYCYVVRSEGTYGVSGLASPLLNRSQETCAVPLDNVAPCAPELQVINACGENFNCEDEDLLFNTLEWDAPENICPETYRDVAAYRIYFAASELDAFEEIETLPGSAVLRFEHKPERGLAGCYAVSAIDTAGNESALSQAICVDNCPSYELPNTFTPNGDGFNDVFRPRAACFIERVEFQVYNRWGQLVFKTGDPELSWTGANTAGQELPSGAYYYTCRIFERRVGGVVALPELQSGWIELVR